LQNPQYYCKCFYLAIYFQLRNNIHRIRCNNIEAVAEAP
jgi:hypothetical protein